MIINKLKSYHHIIIIHNENYSTHILKSSFSAGGEKIYRLDIFWLSVMKIYFISCSWCVQMYNKNILSFQWKIRKRNFWNILKLFRIENLQQQMKLMRFSHSAHFTKEWERENEKGSVKWRKRRSENASPMRF